MRLIHLSLTNFRNYARLDIDIPGGQVLLIGGNAQGKTSLLEAIYFLATFASFHASHDRELINFVEARKQLAVTRIVAEFQKVESTKTENLEVRLIQETNGYNGSKRLRKEILLDGVKCKVSQAVGAFNAVLFLPQMMRVVEGSPEDRRRYLNLAIGQVYPAYMSNLNDYNRALSQRNALLKQLNDRGGEIEQLTYWDEQLVDFGARIIFTRIQAIQQLERLAASLHTDLTDSKEVLRLEYQPSYDPHPRPQNQIELPLDSPPDRSSISLERIQHGYFQSLTSLREHNVARGMTTIGPHRDELRFLGNGIDLGTYGSRGQGRTAVLSLKLAEVAWMKENTGNWPVLLLDEVLAELDPARRSDLLSRLRTSEQSMHATADLDLYTKEFIARAHVWEVKAGRLEK